MILKDPKRKKQKIHLEFDDVTNVKIKFDCRENNESCGVAYLTSATVIVDRESKTEEEKNGDQLEKMI